MNAMKTWKERVSGDYSDVRGVHHHWREGASREQVEFELKTASEKLGINSVRLMVREGLWHKDPEAVEARLLEYVRLCAKYGITITCTLSGGNQFFDYKALTEEEWDLKRKYLTSIVKLLKNEPNLLMWDAYNEPFCNEWLYGVKEKDPEEYARRYAIMRADVRRQVELLRELDDDTPITVGHEKAAHLESTNDLVDVIAFHDYLTTRREIEEVFIAAGKASEEQGGKPVVNNEMGCIGRANPYELELQYCQKYHYGYYIFCLIIEGFWGPLHGIMYPDGTIRDPSIVAAILGFYRNRSESRILPQGNREQFAQKAVDRVKKALSIRGIESLFLKKEAPLDEILDAAEMCVNILECCEIVPMDNPPSVQLLRYREMPEEKRDRNEIRKFAYEQAKKLMEYYSLYD